MRKYRGSPLPPHPLLRVINVYKPLSPPAQGLSPHCCPFPAHFPGPWLLSHPSWRWGGCRGPFCIPLSALYLKSPLPHDSPSSTCPCKYSPIKLGVCSLLSLHFFLRGRGLLGKERHRKGKRAAGGGGWSVSLTQPDERMAAVCV